MGKSLTTEEFIQKANRVHNGLYDYSKSNYTHRQDKVVIICPEHGEFLQQAGLHMKGQGCPKCKGNKIRAQRAKTTEQFIAEAREVHGTKYDYSKVVYVNNSQKVEIICPQHGSFMKAPDKHLAGQGCPQCAKLRVADYHRQTPDELLDRCVKVHGDRYDYSRTDFTKGASAKVDIICPTHGVFQQVLTQHYSGQGCPRCAHIKITNARRSDTSDFIAKSQALHGKKYDYRLVDYVQNKSPVEIICQYHGSFYQRPNDHLDGHGCPICAKVLHGKSRSCDEMLDFIQSLRPDLKREVRIGQTDDRRWRSDGYIPELKLHIEYNGLRWHSTQFNQDKYQHLERLKLAEKYGKRVLFIHEDEWWHRNSAVKNLLRHTLGSSRRIYGRNCTVRLVNPTEAVAFYEQYHIQGCYVPPEVSYGLWHEDELVACMSFSTKTSNRKNPYQEDLWELVRFASREAVTGGASKLFKHFIRQHNPKEVVSFSWNHLFTGKLYETLGFVKEKELNVDYTYVDEVKVKRLHKANFQHSRLKTRFSNYDPNLTEEENCARNNWFRIYDCGKKRWKWKAQND
ncbi:hypothetical protein CRG49_000645 [Neisseria sp. N95_16]|uniref:DUF723 domain-containing protein n=1 Tax=Neisseria brasiliensis TaxID=2666100 RepID=A0A7X2KYW9_9NEIS|nr:MULTISPECIES: hypothetical protein [Neisseria]MRN38598.1 hypothetical protein [Neisseria brasiliensis]PJO10761.1 hypothetical protein CRG49_000645 [Neisseria sp. N95_16]